MIKISLQQLKIFVTVAKYQHVSRASEDLCIVQSAVSMGLADLESALSQPLFDRIGKKLILNSNGKMLLPEAEAIIERVIALPQHLQTKAPLQGKLIIGASTTIGNYLLPQLISQFILKYPEVNINLQIGNSEEIIQKVENATIDLGFIESLCESKQLDIKTWQEDELVIIAAPSHPLAKKSSLSWQNFAKTKWILRERGSGTRKIFEEAIKQSFSPKIILELGNSEAIKRAVIAGAGISCLSRLVVEAEIKHKQLIVLPTPRVTMKRQLLVLSHKDRYQSPLIQTFRKFVQTS